MRNQLGSANLTDFMTRFGRSSDGWLSAIRYLPLDESLTLEFHLFDLATMKIEESTEFSVLRVYFQGVRQVIFGRKELGDPSFVQVDSINCKFFKYNSANLLFFDFAPRWTDAEDPVEAVRSLSLDQFLDSQGLCVAVSAEWEIHGTVPNH
ncbi:hypothetical protein IT575_05180 [bacterium]|nr:hypothetical protein [bacterium]